MRKRERGFTLVEMIVTLALMAILTVALVPGLGIPNRQNIRLAAEQICSDFNTMKDQSRVTGGIYTFKIEAGKKNYTITPKVIGNGSGRDGNEKDGINPNVTYNMEVGGASIDKITYNAGTIKKLDGTVVNELKLMLTYDGDDQIKANITYDGVTGHYNITY